jgi:hypothetical protein
MESDTWSGEPEILLKKVVDTSGGNGENSDTIQYSLFEFNSRAGLNIS